VSLAEVGYQAQADARGVEESLT